MSRRRRRRDFDDLRILIPYCRQSMARPGETSDTSLSLDAQEDAVRAYGQQHGYTVERAIRDHDLKGETSERAGVAELLDRARPGVTIGVHLWDRLGRGFVLDAIAEQIEMRGARAISITQSSDRFGRRIHAVLGAQYVEERVEANLKAEGREDSNHFVEATRVTLFDHFNAPGFQSRLLSEFANVDTQRFPPLVDLVRQLEVEVCELLVCGHQLNPFRIASRYVFARLMWRVGVF